jgi:preprotein translocase subunit SecE
MAVDGKVKVASKTSKKDWLGFFREIKAEVKRITWPTKKEVKKASIAVLVVCAMYVAYVGVLDVLFKNLFQLIFKTK